MEYRTIYEIGVGAINPMIWIIPLIFLLSGIVASIKFIKKKHSNNFKENEQKKLMINIFASVFIACFILFHLINGYNESKEYYAANECIVKEGNVDALYEYSLFTGESMVVDGEKFNYARAAMDGGLFYSVRKDVHEGSMVRIYYKSNTGKTIYKMEVKE